MSGDWEYFYKKYLSSSLWKKKRHGFIEGNRNDNEERSCGDLSRCYLCDYCGWNWRIDEMEVHHSHYHFIFGREDRKDVMVVCQGCHPKADRERAQRGEERSHMALEAAIYNSGYETWITKRYGKDAIHDYYDSEIEHERFQQFRERFKEYNW